MPYSTIRTEVDSRGVATVTLNRPEVHNAFNDELIAELTSALVELGADPLIRVVLIAGAGKSFSAGADLNWMRRTSDYSAEENRADALRAAQLMSMLDQLPRPTIARVHGAALGGGVGLVACCDIAVAADTAVFGLSEVRLGIVPAVISPYVVAAIGSRNARRYFLTGERFPADEARRIGLIHEIAAEHELDAAVARHVDAVLAGGPIAITSAKHLVAEVAGRPIDDALTATTAERIAALRASEEGREGIAAFLEKRRPAWRK
jgi:methylglutaconyl-CoA hydratase